jgi:hypothetical protein
MGKLAFQKMPHRQGIEVRTFKNLSSHIRGGQGKSAGEAVGINLVRARVVPAYVQNAGYALPSRHDGGVWI